MVFFNPSLFFPATALGTAFGTPFTIGTSSNASISVSTTAATGNLVCVGVWAYDATGTVTGVSDSKGNSYALAELVNATTVLLGQAAIFYSVITSNLVAANTISVTLGSGTNYLASAFSVTNPKASPLDRNAGTIKLSSLTAATPTGALSVTGELIVGLTASDSSGTYSNSGSFTTPFATATTGSLKTLAGGWETVVGLSSVTYTSTMSSSGNILAAVAAFKPHG